MTAQSFGTKPIDALYRWFADETEPTSPTWSRLCRWIAEHPEVNARLDALPGTKRQPNLFLAAVRYLGGPTEPGDEFADWIDREWPRVERVIMKRSTQTNEPGRAAVLAPILAGLGQPVTLLEVGASAGLCLLPDRYRYRYRPAACPGAGVAAVGPAAAGPNAPVLECTVEGTPPGDVRKLAIALRCGLDPHPLSADDPDDAAWLRALIWPGEHGREDRLADALELAADAPPPILTGDVREGLDALLERVPSGTTPVLMHSATLMYLTEQEREDFAARVRSAGVRWLSYEGVGVLRSVRERTPDVESLRGTPAFIAALDGEPLAVGAPHGSWVRWLPRG